jgi:hypothetical protein
MNYKADFQDQDFAQQQIALRRITEDAPSPCALQTVGVSRFGLSRLGTLTGISRNHLK